MLSRRTRFFALVALLTAALVPGAAVYVPAAHACSLIQTTSPLEFVEESELVVIGRVRTVNDNELVLKPQVFLKGPVSSEELHMSKENNLCPQAELKAGDRILVYIFVAARPLWPFINQVYLLTDGHAIRAGEPQRTEAEVVDVIRAVTGQYAVPAASSSEGAGIDWGHTVIPLGAALAVIFVIGLVLMRVWHRIDPS